MRSPLHTLPALALALAAAFTTLPCARAQDAEDAAPPKLGPWSWPTTPAHLRIATALREARHAGPNDGPLLQQRIVESGREAVAAQIDILLHGRVPETSPKDGPQVLSEKQRELLLGALAKMPQKTVRAELETRLALTPDDNAARLGALRALGMVGDAKDLERMITLAPRKPDSQELALPYASREALRDSVAQLLRRSPAAWTAIAGVVRATDPTAAKTLLDAVGRGRDPRALGVLLQVVRTNPKLSWKVASLVPACGSSLNAERDREFLEWTRNEIVGAPPDYARTLLMVVGTLDDGEWVPQLVARLEDEDSGIREESLSSLRRISGLGFPGDPAMWRTWYETENRWHADRRPQLQALLASPETPKVIGAVREYSEHRTRRGEMSEDLLKLLEHGRPEVRGLVISVLERLGSPVACPALLGMLGDGDPKVAEAAWQALHTISGIEISRDPELLREMFGGS